MHPQAWWVKPLSHYPPHRDRRVCVRNWSKSISYYLEFSFVLDSVRQREELLGVRGSVDNVGTDPHKNCGGVSSSMFTNLEDSEQLISPPALVVLPWGKWSGSKTGEAFENSTETAACNNRAGRLSQGCQQDCQWIEGEWMLWAPTSPYLWNSCSESWQRWRFSGDNVKVYEHFICVGTCAELHLSAPSLTKLQHNHYHSPFCRAQWLSKGAKECTWRYVHDCSFTLAHSHTIPTTIEWINSSTIAEN